LAQENDPPESIVEIAQSRQRPDLSTSGNDWSYHSLPGDNKWHTTPDGDECGDHRVEFLCVVGEVEGDKCIPVRSGRSHCTSSPVSWARLHRHGSWILPNFSI